MADKNFIEDARAKKKKMNKVLIAVAVFFCLILITVLTAIMIKVFTVEDKHFYNLIALTMIVVWFGIITGYFAWAIHFYNINLGLTDQDWAEIRERRKYHPEGVNEPTENPHINETLGLPTGTVRGTVAITLLVGGVAMTIAALGMKGEVSANSFLVDNFDFFKTAFLMMIAFYFGNKSLEMLGYKTGKGKASEGEKTTSTPPPGSSTQVPPPPPAASSGTLKSVMKQTEPKAGSMLPPKDPGEFDNPNAQL